MIDRLVALIVDESKWLTASMGIACCAVALLLVRRRRAATSAGRRTAIPSRLRVAAAMNLFFGMTIGMMAFGHLLAVTTKIAVGTLQGSAAAFYAIGVALALPSWWLVHHALRLAGAGDRVGPRADDLDRGPTTLVLNGWLTVTLLALGIHNLPLAAPGLLNIAHRLQTRPAVGRAIVILAVVLNLGLFVGSLVFLASGGSFEQFSGIEPAGTATGGAPE